MAYQGIENKTEFVAEPYLLADENGRDLMVVMVKATFEFDDNGDLYLAQEQSPLIPEGKYHGEPGESSLMYAPESCFAKNATDIALIGHAYAPQEERVTQLDVGLKIGDLVKVARIIGDRYWCCERNEEATRWYQTEPLPFDKMPLVYERAFGGEDLSPEDEKEHAVEPRNLLGTGIVADNSLQTQVKMPNIEDCAHLIQEVSDRPVPTGFGFVSPNWQPRFDYAGSCDEAWQKTRMPLLPEDFDRRFFNAASEGLIADGFLNGGEHVDLFNLTKSGRVCFYLPGWKPVVSFSFANEEPADLTVNLDSVIINGDDQTVEMLWRAERDVCGRIYDMEKIVVSRGWVERDCAVA